MGLDIRAISGILTEVTDPIGYDFHNLLDADSDTFYINPDFPNHASDFESAEGTINYIRSIDSSDFEFRAGSYSTYNKLRNLICLAVHEVKVEDVWDNANKYSTKPLWELFNFSDCEGTIDTSTSTKILKDLKDSKDKFINYITASSDIGDMDTEHYIGSYDNFIKCFELGSDGGIVIFE